MMATIYASIKNSLSTPSHLFSAHPTTWLSEYWDKIKPEPECAAKRLHI